MNNQELKILIIDDDQVDRQDIKRMLLSKGISLTFQEAITVDAAIHYIKKYQFDVVLLDYKLPQKDSIEFLNIIQNEQLDYNVAVVMLSNCENEELALECIRAGAQDFVLKSDINPTQLMRAIHRAQVKFELERKLKQSSLDYKELAEQDCLTGFANRYMFEQTLKLSIANIDRREHHKLALILFDLDHFKYVNDNYGHYVGDCLIKEVASRVNACLRGNEFFARLGGDEFALILNNLKHSKHAGDVAERVRLAIEQPFNINSNTIKSSISIGIAIHDEHDEIQSEDLFKFADIAMYRAKQNGRNTICYYEDKMQEQFFKRYCLEQQLNHALEVKQFVLMYQPMYSTQSCELTGFEALVRWKVKDEVQLPDHFIAVAEESGIISAIGRWVITNAIEQMAHWRRINEGSRKLTMSINLSSVQCKDMELIGFIDECLKTNNVPAQCIEFELTETALMTNTDAIALFLTELTNIGCSIALDDFGTGFSSISHLHEFPIKTVKIDKSLMLSMEKKKTRSLISGLTRMIHSLNLKLVAEGVETAEALNFCKAQGIQKTQGYYFSKPLGNDEIKMKHFLTNHIVA